LVPVIRSAPIKIIVAEERKAFLLRLPPGLLKDLERWAADDLRSVNAQIEYLLREQVRKHRRSRDQETE
jgi:hypothetical protein